MAIAPGGPTGRTVRTGRKDRRPDIIADVDASGNRFNPNKLLFDPYALELSHDPLNPSNSDATVFASGPTHRTQDSRPKAPKGIVLASDASSIGTKPTRAQKDDIIYEVHVRGLTENDADIPTEYRGTYRGAALKASYLAGLGDHDGRVSSRPGDAERRQRRDPELHVQRQLLGL